MCHSGEVHLSLRSSRPQAPTTRKGHRALSVLREPTVAVLVLASTAQSLRHAWFEAAVFAGGAVMILLDRNRSTAPTPPAAPVHVTLLIAVAVFGVLVGMLPRSSLAESVVLCGPGVTASFAVLRRRPEPPPRPAPAGRGLLRFVWVVLALVLALIELTSLLSERAIGVDDPNHPTLSYLFEPFLQPSLARGLATVAWLMVGIWLVRRVRRAGAEP